MKQKQTTAKKIIIAALFTAITMIATLLIQIPLPIGYINLGDGFVFLSAFMLGPFWGVIAAGIGSALADIFGGYVAYAPATFVIKSAMALISWFIYYILNKTTKKTLLSAIIAGIFGACVMAFGYFLYETLFFGTESVPLINIVWNLFQGSIGVMVSSAILQLPIIKRYIKEKNSF